jgi:hypothetical protein
MSDYKILEDNVLTLPGSPAEWCYAPDLFPITVITMSCGGGMGGAQWKEYVSRIQTKDLTADQMLTVTDAVSDKEFVINTRYVVKIENFLMVEANYRSTNTYLTGRDHGVVRALLDDETSEVWLKDNQGHLAYKGEVMG